MSGLDQATRVIRFGVFEVDLRTAELRKKGVRIRLSGQSFQVLEALLLRPGELVTREELKQKLWASDSFGDFEHGLNAAVNRVREALGDSSDRPRFVETLPRRGYRFIAPIDNGESEAKAIEAVPTPSPNGEAPAHADVLKQTSPAAKGRWIAAAIGLLLLIPVGAWLFVRFRDRQSPKVGSATQQEFSVTPLTTLPGQAFSPSFSPDGSQVVFAWDAGNSNVTNPFNLYVKAIGSEKLDQLTHEPGGWIVPAWSPDGSTIAFARQGGKKEGIFSISARGGPEKKLAEATVQGGNAGGMSLSWSSDGRQLVYLTDDGLRILTLENGEVRPVDTGQCTSYAPALSPDGKWIAVSCNGMKTDGVYYLDLLPVKGGAGKHLFRFTGFGGQVAWTNDSQRIIIPDGGSLWEININGGEPRRVSISAERAGGPAIASHGDRLAYASWQYSSNIWRVDTRTGLDRTVFAPSIVEQRLPDISPDGKRIAFNSERSGSQEVWVANLDGSDAVQLSNFHARTGMAKWSPDGRWIAFDSRVSGKAALYIVDPVMALPRQVSTSGIPAADPSWSRDGKWIYFSSPTSDPTGLPPFYRVPPQGGVPERVAQARGFAAQQSKDGRLLYFAIGKEPENERGWIYVLNIATGEQHTLNGMPIVQCENDWVVGSKGIFFVVWTPKPGIDFYDFSSQRVTRTVSLDRLPSDWGGLSLSPDETWLAYSQIDEVASHLMLVEGFR